MTTEFTIPDREECQKLILQFVDVTSTDEVCAQYYLQDRQWDLQRSINDYFGAFTNAQNDHVLQMTTKAPEKFTLLSWNIDGLSEKHIKKRCKAVCMQIERNQLDIIFLQEVIPITLEYIKSKLPLYLVISSSSVARTDNYFTVVLLRRLTVRVDSFKTVEFENSVMNRSLSLVFAHIGQMKLCLMNTHLESTKDFSEIRKEQLEICFRHVISAPSDVNVIFGGDLNLRDGELGGNGLPPGISDLWIETGARKSCQFTWDMTRNTNLELTGKFKPRCRFDRLYLRTPTDKSAVSVKPTNFGLIGLEKVYNTQSFPSDHWGILCHFELIK